jgi:hypothetical protein
MCGGTGILGRPAMHDIRIREIQERFFRSKESFLGFWGNKCIFRSFLYILDVRIIIILIN